ncbi:MAG: flavin reductase [Deltaproteobacteria bacterium]|nr:MAG: flavin reductase [Deltaproteobacteria bacterium]
MFILGLQGSPRKKGNTSILLSTFLDEAEKLGARTRSLDIVSMNISPCLECGVCEREGFCPIEDDMCMIYPLLRKADIIVLASPVFFYGPPAQMKALIDRCQVLWARKYVHRLIDPGEKWRRGLLLSVGATKGKKLFDGICLTAKYFFDAVGVNFDGALAYRQIEAEGEIAKHPTALSDAREKAGTLARPFLERKKIFFISRNDDCCSQMASAFARYHAGNRLEPESAAIIPAEDINPIARKVMAEKGIDMAFRKPGSIDEALANQSPELIISMACKEACRRFSPDVEIREWNLPDASEKTLPVMRQLRDDIECKVKEELWYDSGF